jgi:hypothetical protein
MTAAERTEVGREVQRGLFTGVRQQQERVV